MRLAGARQGGFRGLKKIRLLNRACLGNGGGAAGQVRA